jgi:type II secretory ATPase GspE/PulE/Tfp pilus assembly ATPase PilB-like protein
MSYLDNTISKKVDECLKEANASRASDIHFEPTKENYRIRFRIDGELKLYSMLSLSFIEPMTTRIKVMANLDITEKRHPQDGQFHCKLIECRVSTCCTLYGEKIVIRLLPQNNNAMKIPTLGLLPAQKKLLLKTIKQKQGLILISGPTGSGKTNTLYAILQALNTLNANIITIEDPIEYPLPGTNQLKVTPEIQLDFSKILRSILRQDPDIIMIGEIRDLETAETCIRAAQTGHLVLSTLHSKTSRGILNRLTGLGIEKQLIHESLTLIITQRLVKKLCQHCKTPIATPKPLQEHFLSHIFQATGCKHCHNGYHQRLALFELLPPPFFFNSSQTISLQDAAFHHIKHGSTSLDAVKSQLSLSI